MAAALAGRGGQRQHAAPVVGHTAGAASLWFLSPSSLLLDSGYEFGPFAGWNALSAR
jgi:hypothetical protein